MRRRSLIALAAVTAACSRLPRQPLVPVPPEQVGPWRRAALATLDPAGAPQPASTFRPVQWIQTAYSSGARAVGVNAFVFTTDAAAFELHQKWNRGSGDVTFHKRSVFVSCRSETDPVREVIDFTKELERAWP
jgi:hypothetical protein